MCCCTLLACGAKVTLASAVCSRHSQTSFNGVTPCGCRQRWGSRGEEAAATGAAEAAAGAGHCGSGCSHRGRSCGAADWWLGGATECGAGAPEWRTCSSASVCPTGIGASRLAASGGPNCSCMLNLERAWLCRTHVTAPHDAAHTGLTLPVLHQVACRLAGPRRWTHGTTRPTSTIPRPASAPGSALSHRQRRRCQPAGRRALIRAPGLHTITMPALECGSGSAQEVRTL